MARATLANVTAHFRKLGHPMELVKGEGYHYFTWDEPEVNIWEDHSVYVFYTSHLDKARWIAEGETLVQRVATLKAERAALAGEGA